MLFVYEKRDEKRLKLAFFMSEWPLTMVHKRQIFMQNRRPHRFHRNKQKYFNIVKRNIIVVRILLFFSHLLVAYFYCSNVNINSTKPYFHRSFDFLKERQSENILTANKPRCAIQSFYFIAARAKFILSFFQPHFFFLSTLDVNLSSSCWSSSLLCTLHKETIRAEVFFLGKENQMWFFVFTLTQNGRFGNSYEFSFV